MLDFFRWLINFGKVFPMNVFIAHEDRFELMTQCAEAGARSERKITEHERSYCITRVRKCWVQQLS